MDVDDLLAQFCEPVYLMGPDTTAEDLGLDVREPQPDDCRCGHEAHPPRLSGTHCTHRACGCRGYRRLP